MATLQSAQFRNKNKKLRDPTPPNETPVFGGGGGSKTMKIDKPKGLKKNPKKHPHRDHAGVRSKRAIQVKKRQH